MGVRIRVYGVVQGVNYRASTQGKAGELGLSGMVRNEPDGSVYIEAEGERSQLEKLIGWCRQGPPRARIDRVIVEECEIVRREKFEILRKF